VLKGASWATDAQLIRKSFRNWYQARYPYVFAKFRCVR
jgi:formylglycine-generating enzyme required for sulfatase activity